MCVAYGGLGALRLSEIEFEVSVWGTQGEASL